jgi:predicted N-acetyltransferase YhbS
MRTMTIMHLADFPDAIPVIADWYIREWGHLRPDDSVERRMTRLRTRLQRGSIPTSFVALRAGAPVGAISLVTCDYDARPELSPWISGLFVPSEFRACGVGSALTARAVQEARALKHPFTYLRATHAVSFYERLGWETVERVKYLGETNTIMRHANIA